MARRRSPEPRSGASWRAPWRYRAAGALRRGATAGTGCAAPGRRTAGVGGAGAQLDLEHADLRRGGRPDLAAQRVREQLMAEADAEERHGARQHRLANRGLFVAQPGVLRLLPDVLGPAHHPERGERAEIRDRLAEIEAHRVRRDPVLPQELPEEARVARLHVLEDENAWRAHGPSGVSDAYRPLPSGERRLSSDSACRCERRAPSMADAALGPAHVLARATSGALVHDGTAGMTRVVPASAWP